MSLAAPVFKYLRFEVLIPVELEMIGRNRPGNFSIQRSCGSNRSLASYHMSIPQLGQCGPKNPYSLRTVRDKAAIGTEDEQYACGIDINFPARKLQAFSVALVELARSGQIAHDLREIIYSPDGKDVYRWDAERGMNSEPVKSILKGGIWTEGDQSHLWHTHCSQYRSAARLVKGTAELVIRALHRAALITTEQMVKYLTDLGVIEPEEPVTPEQIKELQINLNAALNLDPPLLVDGKYGPLTRAAVLGMTNNVSSQVSHAAYVSKVATKEAAAKASTTAIEGV